MSLICLGLIWEGLVRAGVGNAALLPPPSKIFVQLGRLISDGHVYGPVAVTMKRLWVGFACALFAGTALGIATGSSRTLNDLVAPLLETLRYLPKVALVPVLMLFVGMGDATNIISVALAGFFPIWLNVMRGVQGIDPILQQTAATFSLGRTGTLWKITLPAILADIFSGSRVALGLCVVVAVLSEMTMGSDGLGSLIIDTQRSFKVQQMYAWLFILASMGVSINAVLVVLERRIVFWTGSANLRRLEV